MPRDPESVLRPRLLNVPQAALYLGRTPRAVQGLVARGAVPVVRIGQRVQFDVKDLDRLIEENK
jgi:hypothetical protein